MTLETLDQFLKSAKKQLQASSCTFYVRDPFCSDELRLVGMTGVKYKEPMFGFCFPLNLESSLDWDNVELFDSDAHSAKEQSPIVKRALEVIAGDKTFLFGDFVKREGVISSCRLVYKSEGRVEAVLFVNYNQRKNFDDALKDEIRTVFNKVVEDLPSIKEEVRKIESQNIDQLMRSFSPLPINSRKISFVGSQPWEQYLKVILKTLSEIIQEISNENGFGSIHIYNHENETLQMVARTENLDQDAVFHPLSILKGEGIISWVALHKKSLLISDFETSQFKLIHSVVKEGVKSEIAIPIIAGDELIGVLNLESFLPDAFRLVNVRSLWYVVGQAALAYKLSQQTEFNKRLKNLNSGLLALCEEWVADKDQVDFSLEKLAKLAIDQLYATRCHILRYEKVKDSFELAGQSSPNLPFDLPRKKGMTYAILKNKCPIWLSAIESDNKFSIHFWDKDKEHWDKEIAGKDFPDTLNASVKGHGASALLGIPFLVRGKCSGIAWLEYDHDNNELPSIDFMKLAVGFAAHAGLGIEFSLVDLIEKDAVQSIGETLSENLLTTGKLKLDNFDRLEVYVKSEPYSKSSIGGDFFAARVIDNNTVAVLLGDGQGHAVTGALNMIPMLTVFETFWQQSRSVTHIMDKINEISCKIGVRGTAFYCIFTVIDNNLWILGTSAGHDQLIIISGTGDPVQLLPKDPLAKGPMIGLPMLKSQLVEEHKQLSSGDIVILFTDGLKLNSRQIGAIALPHQDDNLSDIADKIFQKAKEKSSPEPLDDDATVLIVRVIK